MHGWSVCPGSFSRSKSAGTRRSLSRKDTKPPQSRLCCNNHASKRARETRVQVRLVSVVCMISLYSAAQTEAAREPKKEWRGGRKTKKAGHAEGSVSSFLRVYASTRAGVESPEEEEEEVEELGGREGRRSHGGAAWVACLSEFVSLCLSRCLSVCVWAVAWDSQRARNVGKEHREWTSEAPSQAAEKTPTL